MSQLYLRTIVILFLFQCIIILRRQNKIASTYRTSLRTLTAKFQQTNNMTTTASITPSLVGFMTMAIYGTLTEALEIYINPPRESLLARFMINVS